MNSMLSEVINKNYKLSKKKQQRKVLTSKTFYPEESFFVSIQVPVTFLVVRVLGIGILLAGGVTRGSYGGRIFRQLPAAILA